MSEETFADSDRVHSFAQFVHFPDGFGHYKPSHSWVTVLLNKIPTTDVMPNEAQI